jgi:hypothetical protein
MPVATAKMLGSKMMSCGGKADLFRQDLVGALADLDLALQVSAWPSSSKAMTTTAAP